MMHAYLATPRARRWMARNKPTRYHAGDVLVLIVSLIIFIGVIL